MAKVISFAGVQLNGTHARALAGPLRLPWNMVPADLNRNGPPARAAVSTGGNSLRGTGNGRGLADWIQESRVFREQCGPGGGMYGTGARYGRGIADNITADFDAFSIRYTAPSAPELRRNGAPRDFQVLGFEKDYSPLLTTGNPLLYVRTTDKRCGEEVLFVPRVAVVGGLVTQAEVDRAVASMAKTPEQHDAIRTRLVAQPALTAVAHEKARRNGDLLDCIAQALGLPGSSAEWRCPSGFSAWFWRLYGTPLGKAVVWGSVALVTLAVVPPVFRLVAGRR